MSDGTHGRMHRALEPKPRVFVRYKRLRQQASTTHLGHYSGIVARSVADRAGWRRAWERGHD
jgi:hypothetical protein